MKNYGYIGTYSYSEKPISAWGHVGYSLLWAIPVVGWIIWFCMALGSRNQNKKNYARSKFCGIVALVLFVVVGVVVALVLSIAGIDLAAMLGLDGLLGGGEAAA